MARERAIVIASRRIQRRHRSKSREDMGAPVAFYWEWKALIPSLDSRAGHSTMDGKSRFFRPEATSLTMQSGHGQNPPFCAQGVIVNNEREAHAVGSRWQFADTPDGGLTSNSCSG